MTLEAFFQRRPDQSQLRLGGLRPARRFKQHAPTLQTQTVFGQPLQGLHVDAVLEDMNPVQQRFVVLILTHGQRGLNDDGAAVHDGIDDVHGAAAELRPVLPRVACAVRAGKGGEHGGMHVEHAAGKGVEKGGRDETHVACEGHGVHACGKQFFHHAPVEALTVGKGLVIEAELDKGKGAVATVLVQKGTLRVGDTIAAGACYGKIRAMMDDKGRRVKEAGPSTPVEILGLNDVPQAGEVFVATENEKEARSFAETFISESKNKLLEDTKAKLSLDDLFSQIKAGNVKELPLIIKADVQGSVEAVKQSLTKLSNEEVVVKVIHGGVGAINESDVSLASASNAIIIGFNVRPDATAKSIAEREKVDLRLYRVIYQAIEDVEAAMKGMLAPKTREVVLGTAECRNVIKIKSVGTISGSYVKSGKIVRNAGVRVIRDGIVIAEDTIASLQRFKDAVKEVNEGYECGIGLERFNDIKEGDLFEAYTIEEYRD